MPNAPDDTEPNALDLERAIRVADVGRILGQAEITVHQQRARGEGPPFFRVGRSIRYRLGDVLAYRDARVVGRKAGAAE